MSMIEELLRDVEIPAFYQARLKVEDAHVDDPEAEVRKSLTREGTLDRIAPGDVVAVSAGSREIASMDKIIKALVDTIKEKGASCFIFPAMGSHGGASAEGQREVLAGYGITEETMGVPVRSSMETVCIGRTKSGIDVHFDKNALSADHIIPVGRIKPHTDFRGKFESGLLKMLTIGGGKQYGASICHQLGMENMSKNVEEIGTCILEKLDIPFGLGIVENAFHQTYCIKAIPAERITEEEPALLLKAKELVPAVPFDKVDVIVCEQIGKEISGTGMDTNVIGRSTVLGVSKPFAERIGVFRLTEKSHGNGNGMGLADCVSDRFYQSLSFEKTYPNAITSNETNVVKLPAVMPTDELCVKFLIKTCTHTGDNGVRIAWIRDSLSLREFYISEGLLPDARGREDLDAGDTAFRAVFGENGDHEGFLPV